VKKIVWPVIIVLLTPLCLLSQPEAGENDAFNEARKTQRPVLLIFSGSDWCLPCIRIKKTILSDTAFKHFAVENLILLTADFPQKEKQSPDLIAANEKLAEEFNPGGLFPLLLLINADKTVVTSLAWENYSASAFVEQLKEKMNNGNKLKEYAANAKLMGSAFSFIVAAENKDKGEALLKDCIEEVKRIENILTEFSETSETAAINNNAGKKPVRVSAETHRLIQRCKNISELSGGAFDITSGVLKKLYRFHNRPAEIPPKQIVKSALEMCGYKKIKLLPASEVLLEKKGMHISFAAIGKGYAADKVKNLMIEKGVVSGVINASGDLTAWGLRPDGSNWKTGVADPDDPSKIILWLSLNDLCIATSGNYEQYFEVNGIRYSHNIDPKTGYPCRGIKSVSVISPSAELSDALATAVLVMGVKAGLHLIDQLPKTHCIMVDEKNKIFTSKKINVNVKA